MIKLLKRLFHFIFHRKKPSDKAISIYDLTDPQAKDFVPAPKVNEELIKKTVERRFKNVRTKGKHPLHKHHFGNFSPMKPI